MIKRTPDKMFIIYCLVNTVALNIIIGPTHNQLIKYSLLADSRKNKQTIRIEMLFNKMSDALYLASDCQQSKPITIISAGVAANCHRHCYENTPLHRLSR